MLVPSTTQRRGAPLRCAPSGDFHCARRSARGQVGTKGWSSRSNQGMGPRSGSGGLGGMFRVEGGLGFKHGASDSEEPIGDAAQGAAMAMTALAQFRVAGAAARIVLDGDTGPMIDGGAQPQMAGLTHEDDAALAAASRHRSDAGQSAQRMIISFAQRFRGLAEQRGEDDPSDARQGSQDGHVALLGFLPRRIFLSAFSELVGEFVEPSMRLLYLLVHQFEARRHGGDVGGRCFDRATGDNERLLAQDAQDLGRLEAANAMGFQQARDAAFARRTALAGVGASTHRSRNQSAARSSPSSSACG